MLKVGKIVGLNSDQNSAQVLISHIKSSNENIPSLFVVSKCICDDAFTRARVALSEGENHFIESQESLPIRVGEVFNLIKEKLSDAEEVSVLVVVIHHGNTLGQALYLICDEGLSAYLFRNSKEINLSKLAPFGQLVSGFIKNEDVLIFSTDNLLELLNNNFKDILQLDINELEDEILMKLPKDRIDPLAAIFLTEKKESNLENDNSMPQIKDNVSTNKSNFNLIKLSQIKIKSFYLFVASSRLKVVIFIVLFTILLFASIKILSKHTQSTERYINNLKIAQSQLDLAKTENGQSIIQMSNIKQASDAINSALIEKPQDSQAQNIKAQIDSFQTDLSNQDIVNDFPVWLDLSLIKTGLNSNRLSIDGNQMLLFDDISKVAVKVATDSKSNQILAGQDSIGQGLFGSITIDNTYIYSLDKGILKIDNNNLTTQTIIKNDPDWNNIIDIYSFSSNIYLLDKGKNELWKYLPIINGYSDKKSFLGSGANVDLSQSVKLQIDGVVYILFSNGQILKFSEGNKETFICSGLTPSLANPKSFFTSADTENVYILDSGNNRLVVCDKKGNFVNQYKSNRFSQFEDLTVDEKNKKVYLLDRNKIYILSLR